MNASVGDDRVAEERLIKHSLVVAGHRTSVSLEGIFWRRLRAIAAERELSMAALVREVDAARGAANLSSALRVFVLRNAGVRDHVVIDDPGIS